MTVGLIIVLFFVIGMLLSAISSSPRPDEEGHIDTPAAAQLPDPVETEPVILTSAPERESIAA